MASQCPLTEILPALVTRVPAPFFAYVEDILSGLASDRNLKQIQNLICNPDVRAFIVALRWRNHTSPFEYNGTVRFNIACTRDDRTLRQSRQGGGADAKSSSPHAREGTRVSRRARCLPKGV